MKISHILNCTPQRSVDPDGGCPNYFEKERAFNYKRIPIFDNRGEDVTAHMETAFKFIEEGKHYGNVLVHCHKGVSRSASFVLGYLMKKNEMTLEEAMSHVQSCRPVVQPNQSFMTQLEAYDSHLSLARQDDNPNAGMDAQLFDREMTSNVSVKVGPNPPLGPNIDPNIGPILAPVASPSSSSSSSSTSSSSPAAADPRRVVIGPTMGPPEKASPLEAGLVDEAVALGLGAGAAGPKAELSISIPPPVDIENRGEAEAEEGARKEDGDEEKLKKRQKLI